MNFRPLYLLAVGLMLLLLPSCTLSLGPDGRPQIGVDPLAVGEFTQAAVDRINRDLARSGKGTK